VVVQVSVFICENNYFRDSVSLSVWNLLLVSFGEYVKPILLPQCYDIGYSLNCLKITQNYCTSVFFYLFNDCLRFNGVRLLSRIAIHELLSAVRVKWRWNFIW